MNGEKICIPKRRFKEFQNTDAWEQRKVTEVGKIFIGLVTTMTDHYTTEGALLIRNSDIKDGRFEFGENPIFLERSFAQANSSRMHQVGDVITVHTGDVGTSAVIRENEEKSIGFATIVTRPYPQIIDSNYLCVFLNTEKHKKWAVGVSTGDGRTNYNLGDYNKCVIPIPSLEEQKKISVFIKDLNNLITLHQRKLEKMKSMKAAYLTEMFPQEGEVVPKRRFSGFTDAWEQRKLSELYNFSQGMQVAIDDQSSEKTPKSERFIRIVDVTQADEPERYIINETGKGHVDEDDIFFVRYGAVGTVGIGYKGTIANNLFKLKPKEKLVPSYMYQYFSSGEFNNKLLSMSASTSMPAINFTALNNLVVRYPSIKEQIQIGTFFQNLDNLITLHQRKLDKLQNIKKAYLNEMFI